MDGHLGCLQFGATMNKPAVNIEVQVRVWTYTFNSMGAYLGMEMQDHMGTLCLKWLYHFYIPSNSVWGVWFLCILDDLLDYGHLSVHEVIFHCAFDLYIPGD